MSPLLRSGGISGGTYRFPRSPSTRDHDCAMITIRRDRPLLRIGHRGAAKLAPANTIASFEAAIAAGVDWIEFDVLDLPDGRLVIAHDRTALEAEVPSLDDAIDWLAARDIGLHVDLKTHAHGREVADVLTRHGVLDRTFVSSHNWRALREIAEHAPAVTRGYSYPEDRLGIGKVKPLLPVMGAAVLAMRTALPSRVDRWLRRAGASVAVLHYYFVSRTVIDRCHALGAPVIAWTVDDPKLLRRLAALGVDGVVSNDPRIFEAL
jgi:glycerophosphoryl diester phosphodiesterase